MLDVDDRYLQQQQELLKEYIDTPEELETEITEVSEYAAKMLFAKGKAEVEFNIPEEDEPRLYKIGIRKDIKNFKETIQLVVIDLRKYEENKGRYIPFTVEAEINNRQSYLENLQALCEAFFRHISGAIQPEELD